MKLSGKLIVFLLLFTILKINSQWQQTSAGMHDLRVYSIAANQTYIFAGTYQSLSVSSNNGISWSMVSFNSQLEPVVSIIVNNSNIYCGVTGYGVTVSANNGGYWTFHHPLGNRVIYSMTITAEGKLFASVSGFISGGGSPGVHVSLDNGYSFTPVTLQNKNVFALTSVNNVIFAGLQSEGVLKSTNNGENWTQTPLNGITVTSLVSNSGFLIAGTEGSGVFVSSDAGSSWVNSSLNSGVIHTLNAQGNIIFAGLSSPNNFYVSNDNGFNWALKNDGLGNVTVRSVCGINGFVFAGTSANGVYRRSLSELTAIQTLSNEIPNNFSLSQNYPNPFNPETTINFSIPSVETTRRVVSLKVYNISGREVATLVNQQLTPGTYSVQWDASNYPSGVYFYNLSSGGFTQTNKMVLIK